MLVFRSLSDVIDDSIRSQLQELYTSLYVSRMTWIKMILLMILYKPFMLKYALVKKNTMSHELCLNITTAVEICPGRSCFIPKARMKRQESLRRNI